MPATPLLVPTPKRLSPEASRDRALDAARRLLVAEGPQAVTLKAVAAEIGRTHANLLHHFGSAAGLQQALIARMASAISAAIRARIAETPADERDPAGIVELVFDAFDRDGAGALASWMILTGNQDALDPILAAIHGLVDELAVDLAPRPRPIAEETLQLMLMALGDALLGAPIARALGLPRRTARDIAADALRQPLG
ncbi:TetR/AcrR family transcriptional regulator [Sphingomonas sp. XXL09]|uniref:TetR/AcrR family transcriptional regulator n=1 Tax=Sphingomonas sp. XXL09 TaxID=3457787 RepID=UPI00406BA8F5